MGVHMINFPRRFPDNPTRGTGNPISEKSHYLYKVDAKFYMETDRKLMFVIKTFVLKLHLFYSPSYHLNKLYFLVNMI